MSTSQGPSSHLLNMVTPQSILAQGRATKNLEGSEYTCCVTVKAVHNKNDEWFNMRCGGPNCMKGVFREGPQWWCIGCENPVAIPIPSFRLELEVYDSTAATIIVLFDDCVRSLVKTTASAILVAQSGFSRAYNLCPNMDDSPYAPVPVRTPDGYNSSLPKCIHDLIGTTLIVAIPTHTYYNHGTYETFNCTSASREESGLITHTPPPYTPPTTPSKPPPTVPTPAKAEGPVICPVDAETESEDEFEAAWGAGGGDE